MAKKDKYHQKLNSFNPAWCLLPPPTNNTTTSSHHKKKSSRDKQRHHSPREVPTEEPASPVVGCMGQVRRCKRPSGPTAAGSVRSSSSSSSSRSRSASPPDPASTDSIIILRPVLKPKVFSALTRVETVEGMDPPLPVEKKKKELVGVHNSVVSLWKRRCGGGGGDVLLQLQLQLQPQVAQIY